MKLAIVLSLIPVLCAKLNEYKFEDYRCDTKPFDVGDDGVIFRCRQRSCPDMAKKMCNEELAQAETECLAYLKKQIDASNKYNHPNILKGTLAILDDGPSVWTLLMDGNLVMFEKMEDRDEELRDLQVRPELRPLSIRISLAIQFISAVVVILKQGKHGDLDLCNILYKLDYNEDSSNVKIAVSDFGDKNLAHPDSGMLGFGVGRLLSSDKKIGLGDSEGPMRERLDLLLKR